MRTKRLRRYEAPLLVKREALPAIAAIIVYPTGYEQDDDWQDET